MPRSRASRGLANWTRAPSYQISPWSGWWTPAIALIRVDLPAPLSPASASTSPGKRSKDTRSSAATPPKCFDSSRADRIGCRSFIAHALGQPLLALVDHHRDDDDDADRDELPERLDIDEHQAELDHRDDQRADHRADDGAGAAEQAGAADHHGGDRIEQQRLARLGGAGGEAGGVE